MTLQVDPGPGTDRASEVFEVSVSGQSTYCYGDERATEYAVPGFWEDSETVHVSCARFGTDTAVVVRVTLIGGGVISSYRVFPRRVFDDRADVQGSDLVISMPPRSKCCVVVNGVRKERLYLCADALAAAEPEGAVVYDGTQVSVPNDGALVFPAGEWDLVNDGTFQDKLLPLGNNAQVYFRRGAWVIGSLSLVTSPTTVSEGVRIFGPGHLSGEWITNEVVQPLPFAEFHEHSLIFAYIAGNYGGDCEVRDITLWRSPGFNIAGAIHRCYDVGILSPWTDNTVGFECLGDPDNSDTLTVHHCFAWTGDDTLIADWFVKSVDARNNLLSTAGSAVFLLGYTQEFPWAFTSYSRIFQNNCVLACAEHYLVDDTEGGSIIQCWIDAPQGDLLNGVFNTVFDGLDVDGDLNNARLLDVGNRAYPWGTSFEQHGQASGLVLRNVVCETTPAEPSLLRALDRTNATNGVQIENVVTGGVRWTARNHASFLTVQNGVYNATIDGVSLVA